MTGAYDDHHPDGDTSSAPAQEPATTDDARNDPRLRPPDPAGTQPKHDPASLLPQHSLATTAATLWAPPATGSGDQEHGEPALLPHRADEAATAPPQDAPTQEPEYSRYSHRVQFALGALLAIGIAGIVLLVAAVVGNNDSSDDRTAAQPSTVRAWSSWRPASGAGVAAAQEIADHVAKQYRLPSGHELVGVTGGALAFGNLPATIAIQQPVAMGGNVDFVDGSAVLFRMCAIGTKSCAIGEGRPSTERQLLLQREALELALYGFRYLGVEEAVVLLPPAKLVRVKSASGKTGPTTSKAPARAVFFRRSEPDVEAALDRPLSKTLPGKTPSIAGVARSRGIELVSSMTSPKQFSFKFQSTNQDASVFLVLRPYSVP